MAKAKKKKAKKKAKKPAKTVAKDIDLMTQSTTVVADKKPILARKEIKHKDHETGWHHVFKIGFITFVAILIIAVIASVITIGNLNVMQSLQLAIVITTVVVCLIIFLAGFIAITQNT